MDNKPKRECSPRSRCERTRECDYCASVRQKNIGDKAEALEMQFGRLTMLVMRPEENTADAIRKLHRKFMRDALSPAGIWTIERGEQFGGLHLNYLCPKPKAHKFRNCKTYIELLEVTGREAAAYISKRSGMPEPVQYRGNLHGTWGKVGEILVSREMLNDAPVVTAAAIETTLSGSKGAMPILNGIEYRTEEEERRGWEEGAPVNGRRVWWTKDPQGQDWTYKHPAPKTEDYKAVAMKHLPNLYAALRKTVQI